MGTNLDAGSCEAFRSLVDVLVRVVKELTLTPGGPKYWVKDSVNDKSSDAVWEHAGADEGEERVRAAGRVERLSWLTRRLREQLGKIASFGGQSKKPRCKERKKGDSLP